MKILWLSHLVPFPPKGGVLQRAYHLLKYTASVFDVHLLAFVQKDLFRIHFSEREDAEKHARSGLEFCNRTEFVDIPVDKFPMGKTLLAAYSIFSKFPYTINWLRSSEYGRSVSRACAENNFDIVHFDTISLVPYLHLLGTRPATLDHHNVESQMMLRRAELESNPLKKKYFQNEGERLRSYEAKHCPQFSTNFMCSTLDEERLLSFCPDAHTRVIPNGVDTGYFRPTDRDTFVTSLVFAGRLSAYANLRAARFISNELWPVLKAQIPEITMDLVGYNPPVEATALADRDPSFRATGYVDDVRDYLDRAAIYLCPIFDGGGTKLKILDAMAMRKAIVATRTACEGIDLVDNESVVFAESADEFAAGIRRLIENPGFARQIAEKAMQIANDRYSYDSIGRDLTDLFAKLKLS